MKFPELNQRQWNQFCDAHMSDPVPLQEADLTKPFVYDRKYGVFYVPGGYHQLAMSFLLALDNDCDSGIEVGEKLNLDFSDETSDYWLKHTPGAAFRSSAGWDKKINVATMKGLTFLERRLFQDCNKLFE